MNVSIIIARALVEGVENARIDRDEFLGRAGFEASRLDDVDGRLDAAEYDSLVGMALDMTGDDALGLHLGEASTVSTYNLLAHMVAHSGSLEEGLGALIRFHRLLQDVPLLSVEQSAETVALVHEAWPGPERCRRFRTETALVGFCKMVRYFARDALLHSVSFEHRAPSYRAEYSRAFEGAERFGEPFSAVVIDRKYLTERQPNHDPEFLAALEAQAEKRVARLLGTLTYAERLREHVIAAPERRDMEAAARALGLSPRTLRRRLREEGAFYDAVVQDALLARSKQLLVDERCSLQEIAYRMGFSDASAFGRAFKRWTGSTPKQYRELHRSESPERTERALPNSTGAPRES